MPETGYILSTASAVVGIAVLPQTSTGGGLIVLTYIGETLVVLVLVSSVLRLAAKMHYRT